MIFSHQSGKGNSLVFLHGFCETHAIWSPFIAPFEKTHHVTVFDLPGFGASSLLSSLTLPAVAEAIWRTLPLDRTYTLIGHSLGGYVSMEMAKQKPTTISGLVLFHSTTKADTPEKKENRMKSVAFIREHGVAEFLKVFIPGLFYQPSLAFIDRMKKITENLSPETVIAYSLAMRDRPDYTDWLAHTSFPKLLIAGEHDTILPYAPLLDTWHSFTHHQTALIPHTAHFGMWENEQDCQEALWEFLRSCDEK